MGIQEPDHKLDATDRDKWLKMQVLGPFALTDTHQRHLTPRGQKAQALLALLALAPRGERTRVWLRDRLWSSSDTKKAATSLRQTVFELKRDLGEVVDELLIIGSSTIRLRLDRLWVDVWALNETPSVFHKLGLTSETQLLEGMDIADEEFEDWLRTERTLWADKIETFSQLPVEASPLPARPLAIQSVAPPAPGPATFSIGYLPNIQHGCDDKTMHLADYILEGIARNLKELEQINIFDFRDADLPSDQLVGALEVEYYVRMRTLQVGDSITFTFFLHRAPQMILEWSQSVQASRSDVFSDDVSLVSGFIAQNVDRLVRSLFDKPSSNCLKEPNSQQIAYTALNLMFRLDPNALQESLNLLDTAQADAPNTIYPALKAYLYSFKLGENLGTVSSDEAEETRAMVEQVLQTNPFNSITLASLGHVVGYGFGDHAAAQDLLERAIKLNPTQAFAWDHYALHKLYTGDPKGAQLAARRAVHLGSYSPLKYSFDTTLCMSSMLNGELGQAVNAGRAALAKQPRFTAALRYLAASYGLQNRTEEARSVYGKLLQEDPDFVDPEVQRSRFRIFHKETEEQIFKGLTSCGIK